MLFKSSTFISVHFVKDGLELSEDALLHLFNKELHCCLSEFTFSLELSQPSQYGILDSSFYSRLILKILEPFMIHGLDG